MKLRLLFVVLSLTLFVLLTPLVYASDFTQYKFPDESVEYVGSYIIDDVETYEIYEYSAGDLDIMIFDSSGNRVEDQKRVLEVSFAYYTYKFAEKNYNHLEKDLDTSHDLLEKTKKDYISSYSEINSAIKIILNNVDICLSIEILNICATDELKSLLAEKRWGKPDWDKTIKENKNLRGQILELSSDSKINSKDVLDFYRGGLAINLFLSEINKEYSEDIPMKYSYEVIGKENSKLAEDNSKDISSRLVNLRKLSKELDDNVDKELKEVKLSIHSLKSQGTDTSSLDKEYCSIRRLKPKRSLLTSERFSIYIEKEFEMEERVISLQKKASVVDLTQKSVYDKFLGRLSALLWKISPCL